MQQYNKTVQKKIIFDDVLKENIKEYNLDWPQIPGHPHRILKIGDPHEAKYQYLIRILEDVATKDFNDSKAFEYSKNMVNIYKNK